MIFRQGVVCRGLRTAAPSRIVGIVRSLFSLPVLTVGAQKRSLGFDDPFELPLDPELAAHQWHAGQLMYCQSDMEYGVPRKKVVDLSAQTCGRVRWMGDFALWYI